MWMYACDVMFLHHHHGHHPHGHHHRHVSLCVRLCVMVIIIVMFAFGSRHQERNLKLYRFLERVNAEAGMELVERVVVGRETGKMVTVGRETGKRLTLVASFTRGAASALGDKYVGDFSFSPTTTKVTFEPQLESGRFEDVSATGSLRVLRRTGVG